MRRSEQIVLSIFLTGLSLIALGLFLYLQKIMAMYKIDWEIQMAVIGFFILIISLVMSKAFSKVE